MCKVTGDARWFNPVQKNELSVIHRNLIFTHYSVDLFDYSEPTHFGMSTVGILFLINFENSMGMVNLMQFYGNMDII